MRNRIFLSLLPVIVGAVTTLSALPAGAAPDGKTIFTQTANPACGSCHTLSDAGTTGTIGPDLDKFLKNKDAKFIQQSIEDPGAYVEKRFPDGVMPANYKETLQPEEIKALTDYLVKVASK